MNFITAANSIFWGWTIILMLIGVGLFYTIKLKFPQYRFFKLMFKSLVSKKQNENGVSSYGALCAAVGGQVGTGNLAGVATAIAAGGPGAVFWMWIIGILGMSTIFSEAVLAQLFKQKNDDGTYRGGPAYYLEQGLNSKFLAVFFAITCTLGSCIIVAMLQCNSIAAAISNVSTVPRIAVGIFVAILTALVIFGGIKRIATIAQYIVPFMALLYLVVAILTIFVNISKIPAVFSLIFQSAFGVKGLTGGVMGQTVKSAFRYGTARGLFSNEAGQGTTPIVHAAADVRHPVTQGFSAMLGVFMDTLVICSSTAFIILLTDSQVMGLTGIELTQSAVNQVIGSIGPYFLAVCMFLFAWTSLLANIYQGESNVQYLTKNNMIIIKCLRGLCCCLVVIGSIVPTSVMWELADFTNALMIFPNVIGLSLMSGIVIKVLKDYEQQLRQGIDPIWDYNTDVKKIHEEKE